MEARSMKIAGRENGVVTDGRTTRKRKTEERKERSEQMSKIINKRRKDKRDWKRKSVARGDWSDVMESTTKKECWVEIDYKDINRFTAKGEFHKLRKLLNLELSNET